MASPPPLDPADVVDVAGLPEDVPNDPPPPYPSRSRRTRRPRRTNIRHIQTSPHQSSASQQTASPDSPSDASPHPLNNSEHDGDVEVSPVQRHTTEGAPPHDPSETTPLLSPICRTQNGHRTGRDRRQSISHTSILSSISQSPSLAQTVRSLFQVEYDPDYDEEGDATAFLLRAGEHEGYTRLDCALPAVHSPPTESARTGRRWFSVAGMKKYFRPLTRKPYYMSLFHLLMVNFPYALAAWVYLFVFTLTGTVLLMALPLGAVLCFFNLIGARAFARGELYLQTKFHSPLPYPPPYPPRPIFSRLRPRAPTASEIEAGHSHGRNNHSEEFELETSFYKNTYAMFTDPTSYQALFYFLVIKPAITLIFSLLLIVLVIPALVLVVTAPPALRAVRRLGVWQAGVAVEGLYLAVR
ncbi:hypothetical protein D9758_011531 [Tetrapyrgos nigripes]|uniref:Sensor domain-containing protein n=1 Tax=Tetrapyrgos nigripes TaxID=182062 RepID=A0A8H5FRP9_9AGAR|nr:hypothetical protein D9758_011531 [Tetrapyrgos nigripes]